ncbi:unnamed protein product [Linum trigynum]|uniref:Secreted protein n=1 Tax=Linum trigynum TaxID=586398 RepID=A0AAV2FUJ5_9ROSI
MQTYLYSTLYSLFLVRLSSHLLRSPSSPFSLTISVSPTAHAQTPGGRPQLHSGCSSPDRGMITSPSAA